ncbi:MarR family winged helix-turn-helix transcriptional regulator [Plantactinospora siamensis]|uniref:MarR family winged helix-turn-helix transcriptional regulator n=1 Tax=Plantactinospora siamensis TaxID=555372 RepID=A0ABV6NT03_9ACTN
MATDRGRRPDEPGAEVLRAVEDELTLLLRRTRTISWDVAREVQADLEPNAYGLLLCLRRTGRVRLTELAAQLGLSKGTLSRQLTSLERLGLVRRVPDPQDGRAALLELTSEGQRRFDGARSARMRQLRLALDGWPARDLAEFARLLHRFNEAG